jgi:hypothetical protein
MDSMTVNWSVSRQNVSRQNVFRQKDVEPSVTSSIRFPSYFAKINYSKGSASLSRKTLARQTFWPTDICPSHIWKLFICPTNI